MMRILVGLTTAAVMALSTPGTAVAAQPASARLQADLARYAATRSDTVSVGVYDLTTRRTYGYRTAAAYDNASIIKVNILQTVLWRAQRAGRWLTAWEQQQAVPMIRSSSNDAATALWNHVGGARGVAAYDKVLGLRGTTFDAAGRWGLTRSTVGDQLTLLKAAMAPGGPLSARSRVFLRTQMARVASDQRWGVSAGVPAGHTELKNGWLPRATNGWRINSIGQVKVNGRYYLIAVLTTDNTSMAYGIATVEGISRIVYRDLAP
ncbi:MAG: hypothetical protein JWN55_2562 [Frankiales bacterium]|nr:hypothetical protein [Frankiales bacterium]